MKHIEVILLLAIIAGGISYYFWASPSDNSTPPISPPPPPPPPPVTGEELRIGVISDIHYRPLEYGSRAEFGDQANINETLDLFIRDMRQFKPDFIIQLGDLADSWAPGGSQGSVPWPQYEESLKKAMQKLREVGCPVYSVLGNHEAAEVICQPDISFSKIMHITGQKDEWYSFTIKGHLIVVLFTGRQMSADKTDLMITQEQIDWFRQVMDSYTMPTIVFMHVPVDGWSPYKYDNPKNAEKIRQIIENDNDVLFCVYGHIHHHWDNAFRNIKNGVIYFHCPTPYVSTTSNQRWFSTQVRSPQWFRITLKPQENYWIVDNYNPDFGDWSGNYTQNEMFSAYYPECFPTVFIFSIERACLEKRKESVRKLSIF